MIRHWNRHLSTEADPARRSRMRRSRAINAFGLSVTALVLVVVLVTKFTQGAYIAILAMAVLFFLMKAIRRHYDNVNRALIVEEFDAALPSRVHGIVLVSRLHKPAMQALAFARSSRFNTLEAVTVELEPEKTAQLLADWETHNIPVPLTLLESPYREFVRPVVRYVRELRRASPRDIVAVFIPEYVVGHWWEQLLHNQSALRLKGRLLFTPGVMVTSVPYLLPSSAAAERRARRIRNVPGEVRRGAPSRAEQDPVDVEDPTRP
jgi:hypothetical protein